MDNNPIKNKFKTSLEDTLKNTPHNKIVLPSEGVIYDKDNVLSKGHVHIRYMKGEDEEVLLSPTHFKENTFLEALLEKVVLEPDFNVYDLTTGDRLYLVLSARTMSLGSKFHVSEIKCPSCDTKHENVEFDIEQIQEREILHQPVEKNKNKFKFTLPVTEDVIHIQATTGHVEQEMENKAKRMKKQGQELTISHRVTELLIDSTGIDAGSGIPTYGQKLNYIRNLPIRDSQFLRKCSSEINGIPDNSVDFQCSNCGHEMKVPVTFGISFFFPDI